MLVSTSPPNFKESAENSTLMTWCFVRTVAQIWVNLPKEHKMGPPRYQTIESKSIPVVQLHGAQTECGSSSDDLTVASVRVIAGSLNGVSGPAKTTTPIEMWDIKLHSAGQVELPVPEGELQASYRVPHPRHRWCPTPQATM